MGTGAAGRIGLPKLGLLFRHLRKSGQTAGDGFMHGLLHGGRRSGEPGVLPGQPAASRLQRHRPVPMSGPLAALPS